MLFCPLLFPFRHIYSCDVCSLQAFFWSNLTNKFVHLQSIPTDGAHAAELFEMDGNLYLAIANFGDPQAKRYSAMSSIWQWRESIIGGTMNCELTHKDISPMCRSAVHLPGQFHQIYSVNTFGATDWEHFTFKNFHYLAVSEEGDLQRGQNSSYFSTVFKVSDKFELS